MSAVDTLALCWRIERRDGAGLALTSHDAADEMDGVIYRPSPGLLPATVVRRGGLTPGSADIDGAICAEALTGTDLALGRWNGASISLDIASWDEAARPTINLISGELGEVALTDEGFTAQLLGPAARLDAPVCPSTSSECRASLGDRHCRVDMAGRRMLVRVASNDGQRLAVEPAAGEGYAGGRCVILDGANCGWSSPIVAVTLEGLELRDLPRFALEPGTRAWIEEGCDKRFTTCRNRFANPLNFRGEPHLPGNDLLTRYPGG